MLERNGYLYFVILSNTQLSFDYYSLAKLVNFSVKTSMYIKIFIAI